MEHGVDHTEDGQKNHLAPTVSSRLSGSEIVSVHVIDAFCPAYSPKRFGVVSIAASRLFDG